MAFIIKQTKLYLMQKNDQIFLAIYIRERFGRFDPVIKAIAIELIRLLKNN